MTDRNDIDVFVSYAHSDRPRVRRLVEAFKAAGLSVWWDTEIEVGSKWREVIRDRLEHAKSVCVVWSSNSTERDFVREEAQHALNRGILIPVLLDETPQPFGFGEVQFASLANAATAKEEMEKIISRIQQLSHGGLDIQAWQTIDNGAQATRYGAEEADRFLDDVRARSDLLRENPGSERALRDALRGVRQTYEAVIDAIDEFLAPLTSIAEPDLSKYRPIASGRMVAEIEERRAHCKRITQLYIESGGLRESLPSTVSGAAKDALDELMWHMAHSDSDLFLQMTAVGSALAKEAAVITNLLLAEQPHAAVRHLRECASTLIPLQQALAEGMGRVNSLIVDLGIDL